MRKKMIIQEDPQQQYPSHNINNSNITCGTQLSDLLKTNKFLITNKRHIYQTKINSFNEKIYKMEELIRTAKDFEQKHQLYEKLCMMESKKKQLVVKLQKINMIEMQMMEVEGQKESEEGQWRIKTQSTCGRIQKHNKLQDKENKKQMRVINRGNRSISISGKCKKGKSSLFNKTCKPFMRVSNFQEQQEEVIDPLEDSKFQLYSQGCKKQKYALKQPHTIYQQLFTNPAQDDQQELKQFSQQQSTPFRNIANPQHQTNQKKQQISTKLQTIKFKQYKLSIISQLTTINQLIKLKNSNPSNLLECPKQQFLHNVQTSLNTIKQKLSQNQLTFRNLKIQQEEYTILDNKTNQLKQQLSEMIRKQRKLFEEIDQLTELKQKNKLTVVKQLQQICTQLEINHRSTITTYDSNQSMMFGILDAIRKFMQTQKITILEKKQIILNLQYKLNMLKCQQQEKKQKIKQMKEQINVEGGKKKQLQKQNAKLLKDQQNLSLQTNRLSEQICQFEDLSGIRKNCYTQLQSKFNKLKSKKTRMQDNLKKLEYQQRQMKQSGERITQLIDRNEKYLNKINQQIKGQRAEREQLVKVIEEKQCEVSDKNEQLRQIEGLILKKGQNVKKWEKQSLDLQQQTIKYSEKVHILSQKILKLQSKIQQKSALLQQNLPQQIKQLQKTKSQLTSHLQHLQNQQASSQNNLQSLQQILDKKQQRIKQLEKSIGAMVKEEEKLFSQNQELLLAKNQLENCIKVMSEKIEKLEESKSGKQSELLTSLTKCKQIEQVYQEKAQQVTQQMEKLHQLQSQLHQNQNEHSAMCKQIQKAQKRLSSITQQIQFNSDQETNLHSRIKQLQKLQNRMVLQVGVRLYTDNNKTYGFEQSLKAGMNVQIKYQIEDILLQLQGVKQLKESYHQEKALNRKLKLDNDRLVKMCEIDENIFQGNVVMMQ